MKKFEFSSSKPQRSHTPTFTGRKFYTKYKDAEFLRNPDNIQTILSKSYELRARLNQEAPGENITVGDMKINQNTPLLVKNTSMHTKLKDHEFTINRLTGLVAAYTFEHRLFFPNIKSSEAIALGLTWDNTNTDKCRLYLSAVSGTEHFYDQFSFWPLVCAIRKLHLSKITPELVVKVAKIKNNNGEKLSKEFKINIQTVSYLWTQFPNATLAELEDMVSRVPDNVFEAVLND